MNRFLTNTLIFLLSLFAMDSAESAQQSSVAPPCRVTAQMSDLDAKIKAKVEIRNVSAVTGAAIPIAWDISTTSLPGSAYLIIALPDAIRFSGDGFVALPPNARAPRSIRSSEEKTRLIIPLSGPLANPKGAADLIFFESGVKRVEWQIVELPLDDAAACVERLVSKGNVSVEVKLGRPQLVTQNRFAVGSPKQTYVSNDSRFLLLEFSDRYQIIDQATGDLLYDHAGTSPRFSHVGRYVTSFDGSGRFEILDIVAEKIIFVSSEIEQGDFGGVRVALWMDNDAALILGYGRKGAIGVTFPLINDRNIFTNDIGCNACHAFGSTSLSVDLDRLSVQAFAQESYQSSMLEVADDASTVKDWDESKPEDRGPPPRRPRFPVATFDPIQILVERLRIAPDQKTDQDEFQWAFSDSVIVSFFDVWNGDVVREKALLSSKLERMRLQANGPVAAVRAHGKVVKRTVEVDGAVVSPKSVLERLAASLAKFDINIAAATTLDAARSSPYSDKKPDKRTDSGLKILRELMGAASKGRASLLLRSEATKAAHNSTLFARTYGTFPACAADEGPEEERPWLAEGHETEEPPIMSANRLVALWRSETINGTIFIVQQTDQCGTAPDLYGDLISVFVPSDTKRPLEVKRLAASYSDGGDVSDPTGIDKARSGLGAALRLTVAPSLSLNFIDKRFLIITSKDSGSALIYDVPSMKLVQLIEGMENPLDVSYVTMTADHKAVVQINSNGDIFFFELASKKLVLRGRFIDDEIVLFDNGLNYESSPEGASYVYVRVPGNSELYSLDQFSSRLAFPGVGKKRISGEPASTSSALGLAPPSLDVEKRGNSYVVTARSELGLFSLNVIVDGQLIQNIPLSGSSIETSVAAESIPKGRWLNFIVEDKQHLRSAVRAFLLGEQTYPGKLQVLAFGVDKFNGGRFAGQPVRDLSFASSDAARFEAGIKRFISTSYSSYASEPLSGFQATQDDLLAAIRKTAEATKSGDTLVLFFASHGFADQGKFSILLPAAKHGGDVVALPFSSISDALKSSRGRIFVFLDACHSANATQDDASEQLAAIEQNVTIITASKGVQSSLESASWGGGIFTTSVLATLSAQPAESHKPLSMEDLYANVRKAVVAATHGVQTPWFRRSEWRGAQSIN